MSTHDLASVPMRLCVGMAGRFGRLALDRVAAESAPRVRSSLRDVEELVRLAEAVGAADTYRSADDVSALFARIMPLQRRPEARRVADWLEVLLSVAQVVEAYEGWELDRRSPAARQIVTQNAAAALDALRVVDEVAAARCVERVLEAAAHADDDTPIAPTAFA